MLSDFWNWLGALPQGAASFLGTLTGSSFGLLALLMGALFNSFLNRRRDDRLRTEDALGLKTALKAELSGISKTLKDNSERLTRPAGATFVGPDISHQVRVMPVLLPKLVLLDAETIQDVIGIYVSIDQYCETLLMFGGKLAQDMRPDRRLIVLSVQHAENVAALNLDIAAKIDRVVTRLAPPPSQS